MFLSAWKSAVNVDLCGSDMPLSQCSLWISIPLFTFISPSLIFNYYTTTSMLVFWETAVSLLKRVLPMDCVLAIGLLYSAERYVEMRVNLSDIKGQYISSYRFSWNFKPFQTDF